MSESKMGQNNNCLAYRNGSYNVEQQTLLAARGYGSISQRFDVKPRSRRVMSVPAAVSEEDAVVVLKKNTGRRTSDPERNSLEVYGDRLLPSSRPRRASLQPTATQYKQDQETTSSRRKSLPFENKRSFRFLRGIRSFCGRGQQAETNISRGRSASLGQVIVAMAHHRLRTSESTGGSPVPRHPSEQNAIEEQKPPTQDEDSELHQPASVESLVRRCASCFDEDGECSSIEFPRVLFLTHRWFMTSEQLLVLFSQLYEDENSPSNVKKQVFYAIRFWMNEFAHTFDLDAALVQAVKDLQDLATKDDRVDCSIIELSNRESYRWMRPEHLSVRPPQGAGRKRRKVSLVFHHLQPEELAIHMSYLEFKCFRRLTFDDFHKYAVHGTIKDNAKLERSVFLFNNITYWVQCMVLGQHTPQERAAVITKYIKIAQKLREMRNYNTLMAIVGGLTHTAIARLKKTMSSLAKDTIKALEELVDLLDSRSNYVAYRRDYAQKDDTFKIPIVGIHMKDIIGLHAALPDRVGDGLINVKKMMTIGATFQEIMALQQTPFPHEVNKDLLNTLRVSLYLYYTEDEIYALSLQREPRDTRLSTSSSGSPSKMNSMVFAEFTKFTCQLDSETVKQHVTAMVESVFKTYDHDNDGFISEEEFNSFTDNFPMMESFSAMDVDRDGRISRMEMCGYFMKASAVRRNDFCQNFTHDFIETSYFHPTFCEECEKLLWGLVKQGWKCKGCGINCHKHCKDRIVQECRPKQQTNQQSQQTGNGVAAKRNGTREKSSVSSESDISANGDVVTTILAAGNVQPLDDEAFDSSTEVSSIQANHGSPSAMRRSTSLASADAPSRSLLRQLHDSKTPPPTRKSSSPDSGRRSLQRKMQKIIPKRHTSSKTRTISDASTQTAPRSPTTQMLPSTPPLKSFLYPASPGSRFRAKRSPGNGKLTNGRLGSAGEEIDSSYESPISNIQHSNNNHVIQHTAVYQSGQAQMEKNLKNLEIKDAGQTTGKNLGVQLTNYTTTDESSPGLQTPQMRNASHLSVTRRDSGLSGCSLYTMASTEDTSFTATPILLSEYNPGNSPQLASGKTPSNTFKFPAIFSFEDLDKGNSSQADIGNLRAENLRLRETNVFLQGQLNTAHEYAKNLENKLKELGIELPTSHAAAPKERQKD